MIRSVRTKGGIALVILVIGLLAACHQRSIKVVSEKYDSGQPKVVFYFHSEEDAAQHPVAIVKDGISHSNKPLSFDIERYYPDGRLYCKGQYVNGQTCGLWQYFYSSGTRQAKCYYWNGSGGIVSACWKWAILRSGSAFEQALTTNRNLRSY